MRPTPVDQAMRGGQQLDVLRVVLDRGGEANGGEHLVQRIPDVLELVVKFLAVMVEPVLKAFYQIGRKVGAVARRIAVKRNFREPIADQRLVAGRRTGEPAPFEPDRRPGESVQEHPPIAVEIGPGPAGIKPCSHGLEQCLRRLGPPSMAKGWGFAIVHHGHEFQVGRARASHGSASRAR